MNTIHGLYRAPCTNSPNYRGHFYFSVTSLHIRPINMKCCDLIGAATIVAARTSEVCVSHQTLLQRALPTNQKSEHVKGSGYARLPLT